MKLSCGSLKPSTDGKKFTKAERNWLIWFGLVSVAVHGAMGMISTVYGPTQNYVACNIGSDPAEISTIWSVSGAGWMAGSIVSSIFFKRYVRQPKHKLIYFSIVMTIGGSLVATFPFAPSLAWLVVIQFVSYFFRGCFAAVNIAHFVYTMGPIRSRPFTMLVHCLVGAGYFIGSLIVRPFLPEESENSQAVCQDNSTASTSCDFEGAVPIMSGLPSVFWPYIILSVIVVAVSLLFLPLALCTSSKNFKMPVYKDDEEDEDAKTKDDFPRLFKWLPLIILVFFFYALSCGIERIFQSTVFTFGLCGPLELQPKDASLSDNSYNGGFMVGRIVGTLIAGFVLPRNMLSASLLVNLGAAILLAIVASNSAAGLYAGSAMVGFAVSWQYGSAFSWTAQKLDVTGILASLFAAACGIGGMSFVPLAGYLKKANPMAMIWIILSFTVAHVVLWAGMWFTARHLKAKEEKENRERSNKVELNKM